MNSVRYFPSLELRLRDKVRTVARSTAAGIHRRVGTPQTLAVGSGSEHICTKKNMSFAVGGSKAGAMRGNKIHAPVRLKHPWYAERL